MNVCSEEGSLFYWILSSVFWNRKNLHLQIHPLPSVFFLVLKLGGTSEKNHPVDPLVSKRRKNSNNEIKKEKEKKGFYYNRQTSIYKYFSFTYLHMQISFILSFKTISLALLSRYLWWTYNLDAFHSGDGFLQMTF